MRMKKVHLDAKTMTQWSQMAHAIYLDSLMSESSLTCEQIAFHGGTSLHLSWKSQRFSEDLDFLLSKEVKDLDVITEKIKQSIQEKFLSINPDFIVEIKDKTKNADRMPVYHIVVSHPGYIGNAMVKAEFWKVTPDYLKKYPTEFRTPSTSDFISHISNPVPAATLKTAYCDKLTAFATRPHLKWRDIYDLWWIGTQTDVSLDLCDVSNQFLHNISAYTPLQGLPPGDALRLFLKQSKSEIIKKADPDLKKWLPENLWTRLNPKGVDQMVDYVYYALESVADLIDNNDQKSQLKNLKSIRP
jgi:predicted nucleotidyltransferase component of viral defense system